MVRVGGTPLPLLPAINVQVLLQMHVQVVSQVQTSLLPQLVQELGSLLQGAEWLG